MTQDEFAGLLNISVNTFGAISFSKEDDVRFLVQIYNAPDITQRIKSYSR